MQNTVRWRSDQFQPTHIWNPWSNETDTNLEDSACTVRVLLFFPTLHRHFKIVRAMALKTLGNLSAISKNVSISYNMLAILTCIHSLFFSLMMYKLPIFEMQ